ncbi:helix-turn-helix domain-containing protein [Streptosporangium sp. NPDC005286]|uniref:helix-turn-helix domain-containing protein n=1 Tax=Streptosporangium sp. NPDC005286 TaxID=3154463 RepID=UPI0033BA0B35
MGRPGVRHEATAGPRAANEAAVRHHGRRSGDPDPVKRTDGPAPHPWSSAGGSGRIDRWGFVRSAAADCLAGTELAKAVRPARLAPSTLSDLLSGETRPSAETLELFLTACGVPEEARGSWRSARKRALTVAPALAGVEQADPRLLGVHAAIEAPGATGELPVYVLRDTDTDPRGVRALVGRAAERGGLVVLVGSSSVGKTRCAYEAIRALVPQWWLLHPADADHVRQAAADPPSRLVVWLDELHGAAAALAPVAAPGTMGRPSGYLVADYLQQHAGAQRRTTKVPGATWRALCEHLTDPADQASTGRAAQDRLLYCYAEPLYRHTADAGDESAATSLVGLLVEQGRAEEAITVLRTRADTGDDIAALRLSGLLVEQGRAEELRVRADTGAPHAAGCLADLLAEQGRVEELRARVDSGDTGAAFRLVDLLAEQGQVEELRTRAATGNPYAAHRPCRQSSSASRFQPK